MPEARESLPYRVLARKYRPVDFTTLIGQEAMVRTLRNAIATGRIAHAFMLTGVRGVGKTTTARIIARALNCIGPDGKRRADHRSLRRVRALQVDHRGPPRRRDRDGRRLAHRRRRRPRADRGRALPRRSRRATRSTSSTKCTCCRQQAFNALLKTLEEPPPHVKFIFATTEIRKVPVTVLSRCQRFDLKRVPQDVLVEHFGKIAAAEKVEISPEALALLARAADGSVRDGLSMLDQAIAHGGGVVDAAQVRDMLGLADRSRVLELFEKTMRGDAPGGRGRAGRDARLRRRSGGDPAGTCSSSTHWVTRLKVAPEAGASIGRQRARRRARHGAQSSPWPR